MVGMILFRLALAAGHADVAGNAVSNAGAVMSDLNMQSADERVL